MNPKTLWWVLIVFWCGMIFYQSSRPAPLSDGQSLYIVKVINHWASVIVGKEVAVVSNHMVRKSAHFTEYLVLGLLFFNGFFSSKAALKAFALALIIGVCYAASDEIHQFFVPGRTMKVTDIMIDGLGVFCGVGVMYWAALAKLSRVKRGGVR